MGDGRNPAAKRELLERRVLFWFGHHGESAREKDEEEVFCCCCWADDGGGLERRKVKRKKRRERGVDKDMLLSFCESVVLVLSILEEELASKGVQTGFGFWFG